MNVSPDRATAPDYARRAQVAQRATLASYALLLLTMAAQRVLWSQGVWRNDVIIWLMQAVPLLIFLPGLRRADLRSHAWLCFAILIYFAAGVTQLFLPQRTLLDTIQLALVVATFVSALLFIRWRARADRAGTVR